MSAPADIVVLDIEHRTSEDWLLQLPMRLGADDAATAVALVGAQAQLRLAGKLTTMQPSEILFNGVLCRIDGHQIVLEAPSEHFADKAGHYTGEVLVRLASGFDFVSHIVTLNVHPGLGWVAP
jgi:hypothetical protein